MDHAITLKDLLIVGGSVGGVILLILICFGLLSLFNPFGSGH